MKDFKRSKSLRKGSHAAVLSACAGVSLVISAAAQVAEAQSIPACTAQSCPTGYMQLEVNDIQYAPGLFKLQARVSQAKIPVGDAVFDQITVNLVRPADPGGSPACTESIPNVRVRNSVLNLDIGRQMSGCELDQVIAQEQDLAFQICINSPENCLKPIPLGSTPYAIKANYSVVAQKAHAANESVQAHYAHRVTADTELFLGERTLERLPRFRHAGWKRGAGNRRLGARLQRSGGRHAVGLCGRRHDHVFVAGGWLHPVDACEPRREPRRRITAVHGFLALRRQG